ncbi:MAG: response regulator transcription factor [Burkholderia gladioli]
MDTILVIEPDAAQYRQIEAVLEREGLWPQQAVTARDALHRVTGGGHALVIVAHDIADVDGATIVAAMRATGVSVPILATDSAGSIERCLRMLKAGADDYQPSSIDFEELGARALALLRRQSRAPLPVDPAASAHLHAAGIVLDRIRRVVFVDSTLVMLRPTEFRLLEFLMQNQDRVVTRRMILEAVWQHHFDPGTNLIEVHVKQLRSKLHDRDGKRFIRTVRRAGYYFSGDGDGEAAGRAAPSHDAAPRARADTGRMADSLPA